MSMIYPHSPKVFPNYFESGSDKWKDEVRRINKFGLKQDYNIGDEVEAISFYFLNSQSHRQNEVLIEKGKIDSKYIYKDGGLSYIVVFPRGNGKITSYTHLRRPIEEVSEIDWEAPCSGWG